MNCAIAYDEGLAWNQPVLCSAAVLQLLRKTKAESRHFRFCMQTVNGDILIGGSAGVIGSPESAVDERYHVYKRDVTQT